MNARYLLGGGLAAGVVIFIWGAIAHTALPLPEPMSRFKSEQPVMEAVQAQTSGNGAYYDPRGLFVIVRLIPGMPDTSQNMGPYLMKEAASNLITGLLLAFLLLQLTPRSTAGYAAFGLMVGLFTWLAIDISLWNWYGFPWQLIVYDLLDVPAGAGLAGLLLGWMLRRSSAGEPKAAAAAA